MTMDDETFKKEVLDRLQQIIDMLSSMLPEACLEEAEEDAPVAQSVTEAKTSAAYSLLQEMQDNYQTVLEKWKQERSGA